MSFQNLRAILVMAIASFVLFGCSQTSLQTESSVELSSGPALTSEAVNLTGPMDTTWVTPSTHAYCVQNNVWGGGTPQTIQVNELNGDFTIISANHNSSNWTPSAYPSIYKGRHFGNVTTASGMPIKVSDIDSVRTTWNVVTVPGGKYNCAYDIWFNKTDTSTTPDGTELMIWVYRTTPPYPGGSKIDTVTLNGTSWEVWYGKLDWGNYVAFVRTTGTTVVDFDIKPFIDDCVSRGYIQSSWYLAGVEAGFEIWNGGQGLQSKGFSVTVNKISDNPPAGYTYCANEGQSYSFSQIVDAAYGANGKFNYTNGVIGTIAFNNATFGDPISGIAKKGYYKTVDKTIITIPAKIEAENYVKMSGVNTETCSEGTLNVGWIETGDSMDYYINVSSAGSYTVQYRVTSLYSTGKVDIIVNGVLQTSTVIPNTAGWQNWTTVTTTVNLTAGQKILQLKASGSSWNINWFNLTKTAASSSSSSSSSSQSSTSTSSSQASLSSSSSAGDAYTLVTAPFSFDGAGTYRWKIANIPTYENNWSTVSVKINGMDVTGLYKTPGQLPAKQNGYYYIDYVGSVSWSHFEVK